MTSYKFISNINNNTDSIEVLLRINKKCNQKCLFCSVDNDQITNYFFSDVKIEIDNILSLYSEKNIEFVITGGEPTINPDFINIIDYLYSFGVYIRVQTNAVFFGNYDNFLKIKKYLDKLNFFVSFHSHDEFIYDIITGSKGQFNIALLGIKNLLSAKNLEINIVMNNYNVKNIRDYFIFIGENLGNSSNYYINISILTNIYKYKYASNLLFPFKTFINKMNESEDIIKYYNINISKSFGSPGELPFCIGNKLFYFEDIVYTNYRFIYDRKKLDVCKLCKYDLNCNGVLKLYVEKYGDSEFVPILL